MASSRLNIQGQSKPWRTTDHVSDTIPDLGQKVFVRLMVTQMNIVQEFSPFILPFEPRTEVRNYLFDAAKLAVKK